MRRGVILVANGYVVTVDAVRNVYILVGSSPSMAR